MIVEQNPLCIFFRELRAFADSQDGHYGNQKGDGDGAVGVDYGHGDEQQLEVVLDGVADVDDLGGHCAWR